MITDTSTVQVQVGSWLGQREARATLPARGLWVTLDRQSGIVMRRNCICSYQPCSRTLVLGSMLRKSDMRTRLDAGAGSCGI